MVDCTYAIEDGPAGLRKALDRVAVEAEAAIDSGYSFVVLSDRSFGATRVPVSPLLAIGRVHHHLVQIKKRSRAGAGVGEGEGSSEVVALMHTNASTHSAAP